eukprot:gb/GFBE01021390.1/.p1 GENE.gb/GFBE01021390.1/~~gb/GFBE01021390.1/.p1  ORF type:complete len:335 (+),score=53.04 gb/GFBE01021390.1/:1-1005(+)
MARCLSKGPNLGPQAAASRKSDVRDQLDALVERLRPIKAAPTRPSRTLSTPCRVAPSSRSTTPARALPTCPVGGTKTKIESALFGEERRSASGDSSVETNLRNLMKKIRAGFNESTLGMKVHVDSMKLDVVGGCIEMRGLTVDSPQGFTSDYLLRVGKVIAYVGATRATESNCCVSDVDVLVQTVDVMYERVGSRASVASLMKLLADSCEATHGHISSSEGEPMLKLRRLRIQNIGVQALPSATAMAGLRLRVNDVSYEDVDLETGSAQGLPGIVRSLARALLKRVMVSLRGERTPQKRCPELRAGGSLAKCHAMEKIVPGGFPDPVLRRSVMP